jgi:predicted Fe-Mo cluster-binding NifX family protein
MRLAIPTYDNHVASVADFADTLLLVDVEGKTEAGRKTVDFDVPIVPAKVAVLDHNNVDTLICGAVSRPFAAMVIHSGIELVPFISGNVEDVLNAYLRGSLSDPQFFMPGHRKGMRWCSGRRCRRHGRFRQ